VQESFEQTKQKKGQKYLSDLRVERGAQGEREALLFLEKEGFHLEKKNWKVRSSLDPKKRIQVDLVVSLEKDFYVVEVKKHIWKATGFEQLMSEAQRRRLLHFTFSLQRLKYKEKKWGYMLVWVCGKKIKILERIQFTV
jgi:Holliday junction resolvase-like predicted endonuclease